MKWFKHYTTASRDEKLAALRIEGGFEAYGFYWFILETIAEQIDETDKAEIKLPLKHLQRITGLYPNKLKRLLEHLQMFELCLVNVCEKYVMLQCDNLLKIRDNHTKNLQANKNKIKNKIKIKEINKENRFNEFWELYPKQRAGSKEKASAAYLKAIKKISEDDLINAVRIYAKSEQVAKGFARGTVAWLNNDGWNNQYKPAENQKLIKKQRAVL